jgi:hypothetical protein
VPQRRAASADEPFVTLRRCCSIIEAAASALYLVPSLSAVD